MNPQPARYLNVKIKKHRVSVLIDKILFFRYLRRLHGRFWGIAAVIGMLAGFGVCFIIRPELRSWSTAFSDFGNDIRTAPYFAGAVFFGAYGLWRWRNYLRLTTTRSMPVTGLVTLTMFGLYLVALMPISWKPWPYRIHIFGVTLIGISSLATVVLDGLLSKTKRDAGFRVWRLARVLAFVSIVTGGFVTFGSNDFTGWFSAALLGELLMLLGYGLWIVIKTYHGDGGRTSLAKILKSFVSIE